MAMFSAETPDTVALLKKHVVLMLEAMHLPELAELVRDAMELPWRVRWLFSALFLDPRWVVIPQALNEALKREEDAPGKVQEYLQVAESRRLRLSSLEQYVRGLHSRISTDAELRTIMAGLNAVGGGERSTVDDEVAALVAALGEAGVTVRRDLERIGGCIEEHATGASDELAVIVSMWADPEEEHVTIEEPAATLRGVFAPPPKPLEHTRGQLDSRKRRLEAAKKAQRNIAGRHDRGVLGRSASEQGDTAGGTPRSGTAPHQQAGGSREPRAEENPYGLKLNLLDQSKWVRDKLVARPVIACTVALLSGKN